MLQWRGDSGSPESTGRRILSNGGKKTVTKENVTCDLHMTKTAFNWLINAV